MIERREVPTTVTLKSLVLSAIVVHSCANLVYVFFEWSVCIQAIKMIPCYAL